MSIFSELDALREQARIDLAYIVDTHDPNSVEKRCDTSRKIDAVLTDLIMNVANTVVRRP